jgi:hypothetical protein
MTIDTERPNAERPGARRIPIGTPKGRFEVWTCRVGDNPTAKLLLLHGGPGATSGLNQLAQVSGSAQVVTQGSCREQGRTPKTGRLALTAG